MVVVFWLVVFLGWSPGASVSQAFYAQVCPANRLIQVVWNESLGQYQHVNENNNDYNVFSKENDNSNNSSSSIIATNNNNSTTTEFLRECNCPRPIYHPAYVCPQEARFCAIPVELSEPVLCFQENTSVTLVRNIWPLVCLWYLCFLIFLCCSFRGRHALTFCVNRCFPGTNEILVSRMIVDRRAEQQRIWNFWNNNNTNNNNASAASAGPTTNEYVLKTKRFHSENLQLPPPPPEVPSKPEDNLTLNHGDHVNQEVISSEQQQNNNNEEEEEDENFDDPATCCTICFVPLEEGDRIGDLTCDHVYHVECLKGWLQRKNTCPLCAAPLATPREEENKPPEEDDNDDQADESSSSLSNREEEGNNNNNNDTPLRQV